MIKKRKDVTTGFRDKVKAPNFLAKCEVAAGTNVKLQLEDVLCRLWLWCWLEFPVFSVGLRGEYRTQDPSWLCHFTPVTCGTVHTLMSQPSKGSREQAAHRMFLLSYYM